LLRGLGPRGKKFVRDAFADFTVGKIESHLIRLAAESLDDADRARAAGDEKSARAAGRQFLQTCQRLGFPFPEKP
jgi:hypothetical protein